MEEIIAKINKVIEEEIKPALAMDGGSIEFKKFEDGIVYCQLQGACAGCPGAAMTLKMGVEARLKEVIPEVKEVVNVP
jgi:Fe-S cluster biogenesis protein NfuA